MADENHSGREPAQQQQPDGGEQSRGAPVSLRDPVVDLDGGFVTVNKESLERAEGAPQHVGAS